MITEEINDILVERFVNRVNKANEKYLEEIGKMLKKIKELTPSKAQELIQILKYGGNYEEIVRKIAKYTATNIDEVNTLFENYAKKDQQFYEKFYKYRNMPFVKYAENQALKMQTQALARMTQNEMYNFSRSNVLGYTINDKFYSLRETYNELLDTALLNVGQGKETFDNAMSGILKDIGGSGLRTLNYESGRNIRLDSVVRMHLKGRLRELHIENQKIIGEEIDYDGWEISVHLNPAPDHSSVQGRQFSIEEYDRLQNGLEAKDYKGTICTLDHDGKNGYRPIGEMNCYHYPFVIILGVDKPQYTDKQLQEIIDNNKKGFDFEGKHYTMYEGTQLQRKIERAVREQKDIQILAKESNTKELIEESQKNITTLTRKYKELSQASGLPTKMKRMKVSGYRRIKLDKQLPIEEKKKSLEFTLEQPKMSLEEEFMYLSSELQNKGIDVSNNIYNIKEEQLRNDNMKQLLNLAEKYPHNIESKNTLQLDAVSMKRSYAKAYYSPKKIELNKTQYNNKESYIKSQLRDIEIGWHYKVSEKDLDVYSITHEYGHIVEYEYLRKMKEQAQRSGRRFNFREADKDLRDTLMSRAMKISNEKISTTQFKDKYFSRYGKSKNNYEWFAELFAQHELGEQTPFTQALDEWLEEFYR